MIELNEAEEKNLPKKVREIRAFVRTLSDTERQELRA
jgi:hypothetical protein